MDIKVLKSEVSKIIDQFGKEEIGNRLSQFAMASLKGFIMQEFEKVEDQPKEHFNPMTIDAKNDGT